MPPCLNSKPVIEGDFSPEPILATGEMNVLEWKLPRELDATHARC